MSAVYSGLESDNCDRNRNFGIVAKLCVDILIRLKANFKLKIATDT